ncbi:MAG: helix-turn-helix domain-containing protein [Syntrophorhabdales bacterium]
MRSRWRPRTSGTRRSKRPRCRLSHTLIHERQPEGTAIAKQIGKYRGRKKALKPIHAQEIGRRVAAGQRKAEIARDLGVSRQTLYSYLTSREATWRTVSAYGHTQDLFMCT